MLYNAKSKFISLAIKSYQNSACNNAKRRQLACLTGRWSTSPSSFMSLNQRIFAKQRGNHYHHIDHIPDNRDVKGDKQTQWVTYHAIVVPDVVPVPDYLPNHESVRFIKWNKATSVHRFSSTRSPCFVTFFCVSCECLPGQYVAKVVA